MKYVGMRTFYSFSSIYVFKRMQMQQMTEIYVIVYTFRKGKCVVPECRSDLRCGFVQLWMAGKPRYSFSLVNGNKLKRFVRVPHHRNINYSVLGCIEIDFVSRKLCANVMTRSQAKYLHAIFTFEYYCYQNAFHVCKTKTHTHIDKIVFKFRHFSDVSC